MVNWRIAIIVALAMFAGAILITAPKAGINFGFSSDWHCLWVAKGEPNCIQQAPAAGSTTSPTAVVAAPPHRP